MQQVTVTDTALGIEGPLHRQRSVHAAMYQAGFVAAHFIPQFQACLPAPLCLFRQLHIQ
jgi:hypothetical protein